MLNVACAFANFAINRDASVNGATAVARVASSSPSAAAAAAAAVAFDPDAELDDAFALGFAFAFPLAFVTFDAIELGRTPCSGNEEGFAKPLARKAESLSARVCQNEFPLDVAPSYSSHLRT